MPEGPEIKRAADQIADVLVGQRCDQIMFGLPRLLPHIPKLQHYRIEYVKPRAKAMLIGFSSGFVIYSHNQLYGKWITLAPSQTYSTNRQLRIAIQTSQGKAHLYSASDIEVIADSDLNEHKFLAKLGPDLLDCTTTQNLIYQRINSPQFARRSLGSLLLDQGFLAGMGNYLRSEILFQSRLHPSRLLSSLTESERRVLAKTFFEIAHRSYATEGICVDESTKLALTNQCDEYEFFRFAVFGHEGRPCVVCAEPVQKGEVAGRRLYFCPKCQKK